MRKIYAIIFLISFFTIFLCFSNTVNANGGFFIDFDEHVYIPEQKAVIFWNGTTEEMVLSTKFTADTLNNKAWVVPIQSNTDPEVTEGDIDVFFNVAESFGHSTSKPSYGGYLECFIISIIFLILGFLLLILAIVKKKSKYFIISIVLSVVFLVLSALFFISYIYVGGRIGAGSNDSKIDVIEVKKVDIYDVAIIKANNSTALINWCNKNEFYISDSASDVIDYYCSQENFYFIINKINLSNVYSPDQETEALNKLINGIETPLKIRFQPDIPFYPQKMTSINEGDTKINVYFVTQDSYFDDSNILEVKQLGIYYGYYPDDFERPDQVVWFSFDGSVKDLTQDSYFIQI